MKMPTDPKWREAQLQAMLALGDAPQDAERVLAAMERISPDDPRLLPDPEAFAAMFGSVSADDVRDATADWMVRARPEWKRLLTAQVKETASEFNPHHDALGRFAPGSAAVGLSYHALGRIGKQGRANVTSVRDALERLQAIKTPDSDWSYPVRQGDKLRGHLIGTDGIVKTVVGAWYKAEKLPPALAEFNPWHDALGRFATGGGAMAADTGGGGGDGGSAEHSIAKARITSGNLEDFPAYKKFGDEVNPKVAGQGDGYLREILRDQGFDGLPHVVDDLSPYVQAGEIEIWRGVDRQEYAEQFRSGEVFAGTGVYGNGTYTAMTSDVAKIFAHGGPIMRMAIKKDAKFADHKQLEKEASDSYYKRLDEIMDERDRRFEATRNIANREEALKIRAEAKEWAKREDNKVRVQTSDLGRFAVLRGYDGIHVDQGGTGDYYVILNRTAVRVERAK